MYPADGKADLKFAAHHDVSSEARSDPPDTSTSTSSFPEHSIHRRPNKDLTEAERRAKRELKQRFKADYKRKRLERRFQHAISRKDFAMAEELRIQLLDNGGGKNYGNSGTQVSSFSNGFDDPKNSNGVDRENYGDTGGKVLNLQHQYRPRADEHKVARDFLERLMESLLLRGADVQKKKRRELPTDNKNASEGAFSSTKGNEVQQTEEQTFLGTTSKVRQTQEARRLLQHMSKATQSADMFQSTEALWGYTRQKFFERGILVVDSFLRLMSSDPSTSTKGNDMATLYESIWLLLTKIQSVCCFGCGPGSDVAGVLAFHKQRLAYEDGVRGTFDHPEPTLREALLTDFCIEDWMPIVTHMKELTTTAKTEPKQQIEIAGMSFARCDISEPLLCPSASIGNKDHSYGAKDDTNHEVRHALLASKPDLFMISYVLTETRGEWEGFLVELVKEVMKPDSLLYLAEPTAWQLHRVIRLLEQESEKVGGTDSGPFMDFIWIDSSFDRPDMQELDNRLGPAVLLGRKRDIS